MTDQAEDRNDYPHTVAHTEWKVAMEQFAKHVSGVFREAAEAINGMRPQFEAALRAAASFQASFAPALARMADSLKNLPDHIRAHLATLATHGWYLDLDMDLHQVADFATQLNAGDVHGVDDAFNKYFSRRAEGLEVELCEKFPHRALIIRAAFLAHKNGQYELSVPVFLAQADGICAEIAGVQLYGRSNDTTRLAEVLRMKNLDVFTAALLTPLMGVYPIIFGEDERRGRDEILNRHAILHGESVTYGTLTNSSKGMSLLSFTAWGLDDIASRKSKK